MRSIRGEFLKLGRRPVTWIVMSIALFAMVFLIYFLQYLTLHNSGQSLSPPEISLLESRLYPPGFLDSVLRNLNQLFHVLALVLGALSVGSEFGWGTWKTLFTQGPGRFAVIASKLGVLAGIVVLLTLLLFGAAAGASYIAAVLDSEPVLWPETSDMARAVGAATLVMLLWTSLGAALGALLRQSAIALGVGIVYVIGDSIAWGILTSLAGAKPVLRTLPGVNATVMHHVLTPRRSGLLVGERLDISSAQAAAVTGAYALLFLVVATLVIRRRDVV